MIIDETKALIYMGVIESKIPKPKEQYNEALQYLIDTGVAQQLAKIVDHWAWIMRDAMNNPEIKMKKVKKS